MDERKILLFILFLIIYCLYSVQLWFTSDAALPEKKEIEETVQLESKIEVVLDNNTDIKEVKVIRKTKTIPLFLKNACSVLQVFTEKPSQKCKEEIRNMNESTNTLTVIGITIFLIILIVHAVLDVLNVKEEERARKKLFPDGERRQSLAEFANKKPLRRESSKFGLQLFQISESTTKEEEAEKNSRPTRNAYRRGDSINSYLSDRKVHSETSAPASIGDTSEPKLVKRQSVAKLFGARPVPMVRRSSFPALPLNPDVQAAMLGHRQPSLDSDDEGDKKGHRVRMLRRC